MIEIENEFFTRLKQALLARFPTLTVESAANYSPSDFPFVSIEESDNYEYGRTRDSAVLEKYSAVTYEINIYSNKADGRKRECREIMSVIDELFRSLGFVRQVCRSVASDITRNTNRPGVMAGATMYRLFARYSAVVSDSGAIYGTR